jgi:hypothetical protein
LLVERFRGIKYRGLIEEQAVTLGSLYRAAAWRDLRKLLASCPLAHIRAVGDLAQRSASSRAAAFSVILGSAVLRTRGQPFGLV